MTTAQAGTEPLSTDPSSQQHPACFPPARFVCCHCTFPRTQVQVGASQNTAAKSRAATTCSGLGSHPRAQTGRAWDIPAPTRVTKATLSPGQLHGSANPPSAGEKPGCLPWRGAGVHHHLQSPEEPQLLHCCVSKLQAVGLHSSEEGAQPAYGALSRAGRLMRAESADTVRLHECKHCQSGRTVLHKHSGSALTFPQAPFQSWPGLLVSPRSGFTTRGCRDCTAAWGTLKTTV